MLTRKETRKILVEWQNFLKEAKEETVSGPVIRIFDFDGTEKVAKPLDRVVEESKAVTPEEQLAKIKRETKEKKKWYLKSKKKIRSFAK